MGVIKLPIPNRPTVELHVFRLENFEISTFIHASCPNAAESNHVVDKGLSKWASSSHLFLSCHGYDKSGRNSKKLWLDLSAAHESSGEETLGSGNKLNEESDEFVADNSVAITKYDNDLSASFDMQLEEFLLLSEMLNRSKSQPVYVYLHLSLIWGHHWIKKFLVSDNELLAASLEIPADVS